MTTVAPLPTTPEPFIKKPTDEIKKSGDIGEQLEGKAGAIDAPPLKKKPSGQ